MECGNHSISIGPNNNQQQLTTINNNQQQSTIINNQQQSTTLEVRYERVIA
jgi:hypothetical protein